MFGIDAVKRVGLEAKQLNAKRILVITDPGVPKLGLLNKVMEPLEKENLKAEYYDKVEPEPSITSVEDIFSQARRIGADLLVGLGGGSSLDVTKAAGALMGNSGDPEDYFPLTGKKEFVNPGVPVINIPTTAGTGAEITPWSVIKTRKGIKAWYGPSNYLSPAVAIVDPMMSSTMPPRLTASTGMDALAHGIESALTRTSNPITESLALQSIRLVSQNLRTAVYQGDNLEARYNMALAALTEAFSEGNTGCVEAHAIGMSVGSFHAVHHGMSCAVALPYAMEFNLVVLPDRLKLVAEAMGEDVTGLSQREAAYRGIYAVRQLVRDVGLPTTLHELGVGKDEISKLVEIFLTDPWLKNLYGGCVRQVDKESLTMLLENMWEGKLGER